MNKFNILNTIYSNEKTIIKDLKELLNYNNLKDYDTNRYFYRCIHSMDHISRSIPQYSYEKTSYSDNEYRLKKYITNLIFNPKSDYIPFSNVISTFFRNYDNLSLVPKSDYENTFTLYNFYSNFLHEQNFINKSYGYVRGFKDFMLNSHSWSIHNENKIGTIYGNYVGNSYGVYHQEKNKILFLLVLKKEHINYIRKCLLLNIDIDIRVFELWVDSEFDITGSYFKNIRPHYRKLIKKPFIESGGKIVVKDNIFDNYYKSFYLKDNCSNILELMKNKKLLKESIINKN